MGSASKALVKLFIHGKIVLASALVPEIEEGSHLPTLVVPSEHPDLLWVRYFQTEDQSQDFHTVTPAIDVVTWHENKVLDKNFEGSKSQCTSRTFWIILI